MSKKTIEKEDNEYSPALQLKAFLKETKDEHYNFEETVSYKVSSGSLTLDSVLDGGFGPGLIRLVGYNQAGKTPEAFEIMRNFFKTVPNSRGVYIKAEGRLSKDTIERSGIPFLFGDIEDWPIGTCYVHETNIFQNILSLVQNLIRNNPTNIKYCFILDSVDGVVLREDLKKSLDEANKVSGPQVVVKKFFQQTALPLFKFGHLSIFISQVSANISLTPYAAGPVRTLSSGGGNSLLHIADYILDFSPQFAGDLILENPAAKPDRTKNKILGHLCKLEIKKSSNETKGIKLSYPIKHGRTNGTSIWKELEIVDFLLANQLLIKAGAWFSFEESMFAKIKEIQPETKEKFQGLQSIYDYLEENQSVTQYLYQLGRDYLSAAGLPDNAEIV